MPLLNFQEFKNNQLLEFDQRERLCKEIEDKYGFAPQDLEEDDRQAFRRVFDYIAREGYRFQLQLHSPRAVRAAYIEYLEGEVAEWVSEMETERDDTIEAGYEPLATDGAVSGIHRLYEKIERQRERLRATPEHTMPMPRPWSNPFVLLEERPASEQWPEESAALDAPDALQRFPWLALESDVDFRAFTDTEAARFLRDDDSWEPDEVRTSRAREHLIFLAWLLGASTQRPPPKAIKDAWRSWRPFDRRGG